MDRLPGRPVPTPDIPDIIGIARRLRAQNDKTVGIVISRVPDIIHEEAGQIRRLTLSNI
jgi:hypothetical protein